MTIETLIWIMNQPLIPYSIRQEAWRELCLRCAS